MTVAIKLIGSLPLFRGLSGPYLQAVVDIAQSREFQKGELIFSEGDEGSGFYIVETGRVKIFKLSSEGKEQILHIYGPGKPFGEVPVFQGGHFPAAAQTLEPSRLIFFRRDDFVGLIEKNSGLAMNMLAALSARLREFTVLVENLALKEVPARLASYLLALTREQKNTAGVTLPVSKNQLAGLIGTTPETISRVLTRLVQDGLIAVDNRVITILDPEGMTDVAEAG